MRRQSLLLKINLAILVSPVYSSPNETNESEIHLGTQNLGASTPRN